MEIRIINKEELVPLLTLYKQLHNNTMPILDNKLYCLWDKILRDTNHYIIVGLINSKIISSCVINIILNLTHDQRPYAIIENVITDIHHRNNGYATLLLNYAKGVAISKNCYKIMLLTGSKLEGTIKFYENSGFNKNDKTGFIQWLE